MDLGLTQATQRHIRSPTFQEILKTKPANIAMPLIETVVEQDDDIMEAYLEGNEPSIEDIKRCIRRTKELAFFPNILRLRL